MYNKERHDFLVKRNQGVFVDTKTNQFFYLNTRKHKKYFSFVRVAKNRYVLITDLCDISNCDFHSKMYELQYYDLRYAKPRAAYEAFKKSKSKEI